jgi:hypothetical protein
LLQPHIINDGLQ